MALGLIVGTALQSAANWEGRVSGEKAAKKAFAQSKKYLEQAQGIISQGYGEARKTTKEYTGKAQEYQDPYVDIGLKAKDYFTDLNAQGGMQKKLKQYLEVGDPLFDYANEQTSKALNRKLAATGRLDSGSAIDEDLKRSTQIAYQFSDLADRRLQQEIALNQSLLGTGQHAADTSTQLQYNTGVNLSNLFTREADINAAYEAQIGSAASDMETNIGNIGMNYWGNMAGLAGNVGQAVDEIGQQIAQGAATVATGGASTAATGGASTAATGGASTAATGGASTAATGGGAVPGMPAAPTATGGGSSGGGKQAFIPTYTPMKTSGGQTAVVLQPQQISPMNIPPASTQNYYTYNPNQATTRTGGR